MKNLDRGSERVKDSCIGLNIFDVIKTITKFSNVIGHHLSALNTNGTVYASRLQLDSVIGQLKGQLTRHVCSSGQNASCARAVVSHFAVLPVVIYENVQLMSGFFLKCCHSFD